MASPSFCSSEFCVRERIELSLKTFASRNPKIIKDTTWVEDCHPRQSQDDHRPLKDHESGLVVGKVTVESLPQFGHAVYATDENQNGCDEEAYSELAMKLGPGEPWLLTPLKKLESLGGAHVCIQRGL